MRKVISVHEYKLKPDVETVQFEKAVRKYPISLPGLADYYLLKGVRGSRKNSYAAVWIYESEEAWENLWGSRDNPVSRKDYLENWLVWEDAVLAPLLDRDPDKIKFTSYLEI